MKDHDIEVVRRKRRWEELSAVIYYLFLLLFTSVKKAVEFYVLVHTSQIYSSSPVSHTHTIKKKCADVGISGGGLPMRNTHMQVNSCALLMSVSSGI